jgi:hypothetical protein
MSINWARRVIGSSFAIVGTVSGAVDTETTPIGVSCDHYCVPAPGAQPTRNRAELSDGRACEYTLVTRKSACPAVSRTSAGLAPRSRAWLQWAWLSQWGETALGRPARIAAAFTIRCTDMGSSAPPWRERKTGSSGPASPRSATSSRHIEVGTRIERPEKFKG